MMPAISKTAVFMTFDSGSCLAVHATSFELSKRDNNESPS